VDSIDGVEPTTDTKNVQLFERITAQEAQDLIDNPDLAELGKKYYVPETGYMLVERPHYAKMESTNRISEVGQSWTVLADGYVMLSGASTTSGKNMYIYINGKQVWAAGSYYVMQVVPVARGDVILTAVDSGGSASYIQCRFIPLKIIGANQ
jgi:hypothetical protein